MRQLERSKFRVWVEVHIPELNAQDEVGLVLLDLPHELLNTASHTLTLDEKGKPASLGYGIDDFDDFVHVLFTAL